MQDNIPFVKFIGNIIPDKAAFGACLVKIFDANLDSLRLVKELTSIEIAITDDPCIIFRGNTLITKSMDYFMKYAGTSYLFLILGPLITEVNNLKLSYEIDPLKIQSGEDIDKNMIRLIDLCERFLTRIFESALRCPMFVFYLFIFHVILLFFIFRIMQAAFAHIRNEVKQKYSPDQLEIAKYTSISAFIFLRFFCPAIQNPKRLGLVGKFLSSNMFILTNFFLKND